jgi:DNA polymerase-4
VTVRVRFANLNSVTRSVTLDAPISATVTLAELAEELVCALLADHPREKTISLLAISVSHLEEHWDVELELPLGLDDEARRPGTKKGMARWAADRAVDKIRDRFGWDAIGYGSVALGISASVPDDFASSPKRTCDRHQHTVRPKVRALKQTGAAASIVLRESAATNWVK